MIDYVQINWTASTALSGQNFNHMETMAYVLESQILAHGHPAIHYTKTGSDAKFYPQATGLDADMIDGEDAVDLMGNQCPLGGIVMHEGADIEFDNGYLIADNRWHICDGGQYNGIYTPDTRGYFPKCPTTSNTSGSVGASTLTMTGNAVAGDHVLTIAEIPSHYHTLQDRYYNGSVNIGTDQFNHWQDTLTNSTSQVQRTTSQNHVGADEPHGHIAISISLNAINLSPLWKSFYFICKVK